MAGLSDYRVQVDEVDNEIVELFQRRMEIAEEIGRYKREHDLPVLDRARERAKLTEMASRVPEELQDNVSVLFQLIMEASRTRQYQITDRDNETVKAIESALASTPDLFPQHAFVACQGVEGAYSQIAADRMFKRPSISYFETFDGVFRAVESGFCKYGIVPVENSTAGSVNQVYDLMMQHDFHIVRSVRLKVDHNLLAKPGVKLEDVKDIYSHQQAISQCQTFLSGLEGVQVHVCDNTAMAAKMVAESDRTDVAALSSRSCAELYDLNFLARNVQDKGNNYTRFVCITKGLEIFPGADRTSLMLIVDHTPGSLYKVLSRFYSLDINIIKLESRPIPDRDFEFMFYFDLESQVNAPEFRTLLASLSDVCEEYRYLGSYVEIV